ncbi:MAG TPA: hypothetical protein VG407_03470 [Caulobacteraceae bacterium]|jgi:hypothetical protein|nr:hypothetical protein [Caulobacteraceae bacterium]
MKTVLALFAALGLAATALPAFSADDGPLAPARDGKGQCFHPDAAAKTCASIAWYGWDAKGFLMNRLQVALPSQDAKVVMTVDKAAVLKDGAVCSPIRVEDIVEAKFSVNGAPADDATTDHLRQAVASGWAGVDRALVCVTFTPDGDGFRVDETMNGTARPDLTQHMVWIGKDDGWTVAR